MPANVRATVHYGIVRQYHSAITINVAKNREILSRNFSRNEL